MQGKKNLKKKDTYETRKEAQMKSGTHKNTQEVGIKSKPQTKMRKTFSSEKRR